MTHSEKHAPERFWAFYNFIYKEKCEQLQNEKVQNICNQNIKLVKKTEQV